MRSIRNRSKGQQGLLLAAIIVVICTVLMALAESAVRIRHRMKYGDLWGVESTFTIDPISELRIPIASRSFGPITINSMGFRSPEISAVKVDSGLRIAFLGASTTYSAEVSDNEMTWPYLVWQALQRNWPDISIDFANAGVPGYRISASIQTLEHRVARLKPDIIVIYHAINDLSSNSFDAALQQGLVERPTELDLTWPAKYSLLWYLVEKNLRVLKYKAKARDIEGTLGADSQHLAEPFKADLLKLVHASQKVADIVVLVTFSPRLRREQDAAEQIEAAATNLYYMPYMSIQGLLDAYDAYNQVIREVAAETDALLVGDEYSIPGDASHFADSVHFTDLGSQLMAERVSRALLNSKRIESVLPGAHVAEN